MHPGLTILTTLSESATRHQIDVETEVEREVGVGVGVMIEERVVNRFIRLVSKY